MFLSFLTPFYPYFLWTIGFLVLSYCYLSAYMFVAIQRGIISENDDL
jgi:hypothetical protein